MQNKVLLCCYTADLRDGGKTRPRPTSTCRSFQARVVEGGKQKYFLQQINNKTVFDTLYKLQVVKKVKVIM